ncbi:ABC transporter [Virgisporangium aliadipatigenens]|uniref:ABC transporter n=1 Tax=Virgisporangium aliadipatigenens TaxID=741659 RepID=A0A8J3YPA7_9ACTN|nr:ABC transporter ATP-binding protein [Virgisporangium aliadipatigenens]GIJ48077.1 ABC transporter [Virgisporangium aliadipatigenens]
MDAIRTWGLTKNYGRRTALRGIDLSVPAGPVCGYLGPNGAGKTTTIRLLVGLLRPTSGAAAVFGHDTVRDRERAQRLVGYLPGEFVAYPDLTAGRYLEHLGRLRGGADPSAVARLAERLDLDLTARIGTLSHGNRQKVGIVQAFAHDPPLLILDEPTAGLDPIAQREFLAMVREARDRGRTVFLSSHVLSEVEAVADRVAMLSQGRLLVTEAVDKLKSRAQRRIDLIFDTDPPEEPLRAVPEVRSCTVAGRAVHLMVEGSTARLLQVAAPHRVVSVVTHEPDLEEIFVNYYSREVPQP